MVTPLGSAGIGHPTAGRPTAGHRRPVEVPEQVRAAPPHTRGGRT